MPKDKLANWQKKQKDAELEEYLVAAAKYPKILPKSMLWRSLLERGRFPKRDAELDKMGGTRGYVVLEVHEDGDLVVRWREVRYIVTTEGLVFKEVKLKG